MKRWGVWGAVLAAVLGFGAVRPAIGQTTQAQVIVVSLTGTVDPLSARYVERGLRIGQNAKAAAVLIRIDTPGGLDSSMRSIIKAISTTSVPVVCWVGPSGARAASAGAIILTGCPIAAMAPGTNVGAAHPVGFSGQVLDEKITNDAAAYARALAQAHNRNADLAERMVRDSISVPAEEALRQKAIDLIAATRSQLFEEIAGRSINGVTVTAAHPEFKAVGMTFIESVLHGIIDPNIIFILFLFGLVGIIIEILHPGIRLPGVLGVLSFIISLVLLDLLPVNIAGVVLLIVGMALLAFEVHIHTVGVAATLGVTSLILGGLFLFQSSVPNAAVSKWLVVGIAIALAAFFTLVLRVMIQTRKRLPKPAKLQDVVGAEAVVVRALDPVGIVRAHREQWSARAAAGPIPEGAHVRITGVQGLTLQVEPLEVSHVSQTEGDSR
ncbi:MAG TPA: nodulation protein NfeD [Actinomycetota bacterium]|nr:nodulation protein NfeD [Actinomycetota bacterium]